MSILHVKCVLSLRPALSLRTRNNCELAHHLLSWWWWWCNSTSFNSTSNDFTFHQCHDESLVVWPVGFHLIDNDSRATRDKLYPSDTGTCKKRPFSLISSPPSQPARQRPSDKEAATTARISGTLHNRNGHNYRSAITATTRSECSNYTPRSRTIPEPFNHPSIHSSSP